MPTIEAFYLGVRSDLDPEERDYLSENASDLVGLTFGAGGELISDDSDLGDAYSLFSTATNDTPLYQDIVMLTLDDADGDGVLYENDAGYVGEDLVYDGTASELDSIIEYNVTITYLDGTTASTHMGVMQDELGRAFLVPHQEGRIENDILDDQPIVSIHIDSVNEANYSGLYANVEQDAFITCFVAGTMIATKQGLVNIADLSVGDRVCTMDHGFQAVRWIGAQRVHAVGRFAPINIAVGALGQGLPTRELRLSPQHRILVRSKIAQRIFGVSEVLLPAKKMLGMPGISVVRDAKYVTYWHVLFDQHEIVFSEGAATESFFVGPIAISSLGNEARSEILALFPEFAQRSKLPSPARKIARGKAQKKLLARHRKNSRLMYQG